MQVVHKSVYWADDFVKHATTHCPEEFATLPHNSSYLFVADRLLPVGSRFVQSIGEFRSVWARCTINGDGLEFMSSGGFHSHFPRSSVRFVLEDEHEGEILLHEPFNQIVGNSKYDKSALLRSFIQYVFVATGKARYLTNLKFEDVLGPFEEAVREIAHAQSSPQSPQRTTNTDHTTPKRLMEGMEGHEPDAKRREVQTLVKSTAHIDDATEAPSRHTSALTPDSQRQNAISIFGRSRANPNEMRANSPKDEVESLTQQLSAVKEENKELKKENKELKERLAKQKLEYEGQSKTVDHSSQRTTLYLR